MLTGCKKWMIFFNILFASLVTVSSSTAHANWTLNVGYQNPIVSTWGLNLLYIGSRWGFETGIGWIDAETGTDKNDDKDSKASIHIAGDVDLKYFFSSGTARPFIQGGFGVGLGAQSEVGAGAGTGGGFAGVGILLGSPKLYGYGSYNLGSSENSFVQAGLGFDI